jgi:hypothetical protein
LALFFGNCLGYFFKKLAIFSKSSGHPAPVLRTQYLHNDVL